MPSSILSTLIANTIRRNLHRPPLPLPPPPTVAVPVHAAARPVQAPPAPGALRRDMPHHLAQLAGMSTVQQPHWQRQPMQWCQTQPQARPSPPRWDPPQRQRQPPPPQTARQHVLPRPARPQEQAPQLPPLPLNTPAAEAATRTRMRPGFEGELTSVSWLRDGSRHVYHAIDPALQRAPSTGAQADASATAVHPPAADGGADLGLLRWQADRKARAAAAAQQLIADINARKSQGRPASGPRLDRPAPAERALHTTGVDRTPGPGVLSLRRLHEAAIARQGPPASGGAVRR